jgi:hypothetical protein
MSRWLSGAFWFLPQVRQVLSASKITLLLLWTWSPGPALPTACNSLLQLCITGL